MTEPVQKTATERSRELRERRAQEGLQEVRGIFLPPELHASIKHLARALAELPGVTAAISAGKGGKKPAP